MKLVGLEGPYLGKVFEFDYSKDIILGRSSESSIVLNHVSISRFHSKISFDEGIPYVEDLKSGNGTYLNNEQVKKKKRSKKVINFLSELSSFSFMAQL